MARSILYAHLNKTIIVFYGHTIIIMTITALSQSELHSKSFGAKISHCKKSFFKQNTILELDEVRPFLFFFMRFTVKSLLKGHVIVLGVLECVQNSSSSQLRWLCLLRTFQCKHWARLSNQSFTGSRKQMEGTGKHDDVMVILGSREENDCHASSLLVLLIPNYMIKMMVGNKIHDHYAFKVI